MNIKNIGPAVSGILMAASLTLAAFSLSATADELKFELSGNHEVPPVDTMAAGTASVSVMPDMSVSGSVTTSGINASMAHIHIGKTGTNGPVIIPLTHSADNQWSVPAGSKLSEAQYQAYKAGELYINVHSPDHKGGEIRGQLLPPAAAAGRY